MASLQEQQLSQIRSQFALDWQVPEFRIDFWDGKTADYCVVVPVINEGERIHQFVQRLKQSQVASKADIIIVDGGSTDGSLQQDFLREHGVRGLITKTGPGKLSAQLRVAYAFALASNYCGVITIDGNNKDDPSEIPEFIKAMKQGSDFVQASRFIAGGQGVNTPVMRTLAIRLIHAPVLRLASGFAWTDTTQGFRGYSERLLRHPGISIFRSVFESYELLVYLSYIAPRLGLKCIEIPSTRVYPAGAVPTKISSVRGNLDLLKSLLKAVRGRYTPVVSGPSATQPVSPAG
ncbi:MAG: glycosyltransferase family 2 protein [Cyanobacteriota bacterium]|nr:glycosyltransferase family 2 protein [Cyanobacteriota bacterium]